MFSRIWVRSEARVNPTLRWTSFFFILLAAGPLGAGGDPTALWMSGNQEAGPCLSQLGQRDLAFLAGTAPAPGAPTVSSRLLRGLAAGNGDALSIAFRLVPLLKGETAQKVQKGLADAMADHPQVFLSALQDFLDFARKNNQAAALKETLWDAFVGADFGYDQDLSAEIRDLRHRKALLEGLAYPPAQEAKNFTLQMLKEKIRELPSGF